MKTALRAFALALASTLASACTTAGTSSLPAPSVPNLATTAKLQLAVGTAHIGTPGGFFVGTNVVATFRGSDGNNATGANTPTLTGPPGFNFGENLGNGRSITGVLPSTLIAVFNNLSKGGGYPQALGQGFGPFTGVFGYGFASDNTVSNTIAQALQNSSSKFCVGLAVTAPVANVEVSAPIQNANGAGGAALPPTNVVRSGELGLPLPSGAGTNGGSADPLCPDAPASAASPYFANGFPINYYGGPPSWPSPQGYGSPSYFVGYPIGFNDFTASPVAGTYALAVAYATSTDYSTYGHLSTSAKLTNMTPLPPFTAPTISFNGDGSGIVRLIVPPGVREAIVFVRSSDCDYTANLPADNYAIVTHATGPQQVTFGSNLGPPGADGRPKHTFCTSSDLEAYNAVIRSEGGTPLAQIGFSTVLSAVGFDYPAYESSYPFNTSAAPHIANGAGQADVTTTYPTLVTPTIYDPTVGS